MRRQTGLITAAQAVGVHPRLHRDTHGALVHSYRWHNVLVMDFAARAARRALAYTGVS
ncbi:hypothetical protein [Amycolatopsis sp. NPDC051128]|uniref:hypothetical protein n=1 Tax=Amycolatopsis sp. NPDC051128 TaxID=3155412 RepID=UPI003420EDD5